MKFSPTWPQVALVLGMLAAIILTHAFAPPAVGAVTAIVSTLVGAFFVDAKKLETATPEFVEALKKKSVRPSLIEEALEEAKSQGEKP
jgi:xanthosine utilization system XapX-like protein